jgi:signal transduction histidine kinase
MASNDLLNAGEGTASGAKARDVLRPFWQFYFWALLTPTIFWACRRYRIEQPHLARRILAHIGLAVIVSFTVDIYNDYLRLLTQPDEEQPAAFNPLGELLELSLIYELMVYLVVLAAGFARDYFLRFQARQREAARLQTRTARLEEQLAAARLDALRMQINPHFLFNTLHAVSTLVGDDPQGVRRMIARLSRLLRYVLDETDRQEVPLHQEMRFLRTYLEIMQIRFQGSLHTKIDVTSDLDDALVPNLILQPLVENAVKHGAGETEEVGRVEVHAEAEAGRLLLTVRDNGPHVSADGASNLPEGTGLKNVRARLNGLYGSDAELTFSAVPDGGLTARIALPLRTESKRGRKHERTREQVETSE